MWRPLLAGVIIMAHAIAGASDDDTHRVLRHPLSDGWMFREASASTWLTASVPGCVHTDLLENAVIKDPFFGTNEQQLQWIGQKDWIYRTTFDVPPALLRQERVELVFEGLDTYATVTLNDTLILNADNMFRTWRRSCRSLLREHGNTLSVRFGNVFDRNLPLYESAPFRRQAYANNDQADVKIALYSRKAQFHYGWDWGPRLITCGIWRPVYIEAWSGVRIASVQVLQENVSGRGADITALVEVHATRAGRSHATVTLDSLGLGEADQDLKEGENVIAVRGHLPSPRLWWTNTLGEQYLYRLRSAVRSADGQQDDCTTSVGVRSLEIVREKDAQGRSLYVRLNGVPVFMKGANYIPQDNFQNRVTPSRYEHTIGSAAQANMNMLRVWGGGIYEEDLFYDLCDRYGILIWHDLMFACAMYPADEEFLQNVRQEIADNVRRLRNHPSIALWCGNNENQISWYGWGWKELYDPQTQSVYEREMTRLFGEVIPSVLREVDPTRYYHLTSPIAGYNNVSPMEGDIHYWGVWHGKEPFEHFERNIGRFVSEYGFQSYPELSTVEKFALPEDRQLHSQVMLSHQRCMADERRDREYGNRLIQTYMENLFEVPGDFGSYVYVSQLLQAEGVRMAIEAHRRAKPLCMGSLFWQIDDCWPVASWSSIDYYGNWKALHYAAREAYASVLIAPVVKIDTVECTVVSDKSEPVAGLLTLRIQDFRGKVLRDMSIPIALPAQGTLKAGSWQRAALSGGHPEGDLVMVFSLNSEGKEVARRLAYFGAPKTLALTPPEISVAVEKNATGYLIRLQARSLAKSVHLTCDGIEGYFSDNYFDLLPGVARTLEFRTMVVVRDIQRRLRVVSLVDAR